MLSSRTRLYTLLGFSCLLGYLWLYLNFRIGYFTDPEIIICPVKLVTGIPCPSCGSTHSVLLLFQGKILQALNWNPLGILLALIMLISPVWIGIDLLIKSDSLFVRFKKAEKLFKNKWIAISAVMLILANWWWNIIKDV